MAAKEDVLLDPMRFGEFQKRAGEIFRSVPEEFRREISDLVVHRGKASHPELPDYMTLGECAPDPAIGDASSWTSTVHLYYGSFAAVARREPDFDWEEELRETVLHEIRHHIEDRAGSGKLHSEDYVEEENEKRISGLPFDPHFYRAGESELPGEYWVGPDCFLEITLTPRKVGKLRNRTLELDWRGERLEVPLPERLGASQLIPVEGGWEDDEGNEGGLFVALHVRTSIL